MEKTDDRNFRSIMNEATMNNDTVKEPEVLRELLKEKNFQKLCGNIVKRRVDKNNTVHRIDGI
jgi:hypothetical protein